MHTPKGKVLVIVGDATETVDTLYPYYRLIEAGFQPVVASHEKRCYQMVLHEVKPGWTITKEWEGYSIEAEIAFKDIKPEATFIEDLGADSLDTVELVMAFEEEFGIEIPDEDAEKMQTVGDAITYISEQQG